MDGVIPVSLMAHAAASSEQFLYGFAGWFLRIHAPRVPRSVGPPWLRLVVD